MKEKATLPSKPILRKKQIKKIIIFYVASMLQPNTKFGTDKNHYLKQGNFPECDVRENQGFQSFNEHSAQNDGLKNLLQCTVASYAA